MTSQNSGDPAGAGGERATLECAPGGPYRVRNLAALRGADGTLIPTRAVVALCRCGQSANKPFCDGTHRKVSFDGTLANPDPTAAAVVNPSSPAEIEVTEDGPYHLTGAIEVRGFMPDADAASEGVWLCRCGQSRNKPFCDSSHRSVGFRSRVP